jgi:threonine dehydrogenase-like Zn-dependent dehydrogenase
MKKALCYGPRDLRIVAAPERSPGPGEVKADMLVTTLTTANLRLYQGPLVADLQYPVTLSYTGTARVSEVGAGVSQFRVGDLVYPKFYRACLHCRWCLADKMVACEQMPLGAHNMMVGEQYESALQEYVVFPEERFFPVPAGTPPDAAAMTGFLSVGMQAISTLAPGPDDTVFVMGAGPIGWCCTQIARLRGARVVITDIRADRLELARQFGAAATVDANRPDLRTAIVEACGGEPLLVVEATGTEAGSKMVFDVAGRGAYAAVVGVTNNAITQHFLILKGMTVSGIGGAVKVQEVIDLIGAGKLDLRPAISHRFPFGQLKDAFEFKRASPEAHLVAIDIQS